MNQELCTIKGTRDGLVITIESGSWFPGVLSALDRQLSQAQSFFVGSSAKVLPKQGTLTAAQLDDLEKLIASYGMRLNREPVIERVPLGSSDQEQADAAESEKEDTILVRRTIRSGQRLHYDGNVVVVGDVNPGAELVCTGDIFVLGSLRGMAHAGAEGRIEATVFAFRLQPTQLRIAHLISRAPDEKLPPPEGPEIARVVDNMIQLSVYDH